MYRSEIVKLAIKENNMELIEKYITYLEQTIEKQEYTIFLKDQQLARKRLKDGSVFGWKTLFRG